MRRHNTDEVAGGASSENGALESGRFQRCRRQGCGSSTGWSGMIHASVIHAKLWWSGRFGVSWWHPCLCAAIPLRLLGGLQAR